MKDIFFTGLVEEETAALLRRLIPKGRAVLEIGCGNGTLLASLEPSRGVGISGSKEQNDKAARDDPNLAFYAMDPERDIDIEGTFDYIILHDIIGDLTDVWRVFRNIRSLCNAETRIVVTYFNILWYPIVKLYRCFMGKPPMREKNWFSLDDMRTFYALNGLEMVTQDARVLCPFRIPLVTNLCNRFLSGLPILRHLNIVTYSVAGISGAEMKKYSAKQLSVSVVVPTRNERGNVRGIVERAPSIGSRTEIVFVDGDSSDGTVEEIKKYQELFRGRKEIRLIHQIPPNSDPEKKNMLKLGKGDACRKGFQAATGDVLMILDGDLTVDPEDLEKFYLAIKEGRAQLVNGNRLSYPLEKQSMRYLNLIANRLFGLLFTWLLGQPVKDTLCGTKVLTKASYERIAANRAHFGDFDPFGDFDLLFGAARLNMKILDLPVRYRARTYGDIKIERFKHGLLLLKMCWFAFKRLKTQ